MISRNRRPVARAEAQRSNRSVILALAALLAAAGMVSGCVVETPGPGYHHHWWGWHD